MTLSEKISNNQEEIRKYLYCGYVNWDKLIDRIDRQERNKCKDFADEQIWTFLIACGYAIAGQQGIEKLCFLLTGVDNLVSNKIWIEVLPTSPRIGEGHTHLDLALGDIESRSTTKSGIELNPKDSSWIAFCEMKWYSDISNNVSFDQHRNQLSRVIENAIAFQNNGKYADSVFVNIVTPDIFMDKTNQSRLYCYKFDEYKDSIDILKRDFLNCKLKKEEGKPKWIYPKDIDIRLANLTLRWTSFDSLFAALPDSELLHDIREFEKEYNNAR